MQCVSNTPHSLVSSGSCQQKTCQQSILLRSTKTQKYRNCHHENQCVFRSHSAWIRRRLRFLLNHGSLRLRGSRLRWRRHFNFRSASRTHNTTRDNVSIWCTHVKVAVNVRQETCGTSLPMKVSEHVHHVLAKHGAGLLWHTSGHISVTNNGDIIGCCPHFTLPRHFTVASSESSQVHNNTTSLHRGHGIRSDQKRRSPSRNRCSTHHNINLLQNLQKRCLLCRLELCGTLFRIATSSCTIFLEFNLDPLRTHGCNLIRHITHIPGPHIRTESLRLPDCFEPSNTTTQNKSLGWCVLACGRHFGTMESAEMMRCFNHGTMPCTLCL
mmetsp:Transcript_63476/g.168175  ORF Transcript_63476/g.168175 Transcript_63476/m.168175 type:complete len:326 (+) Transcript_63476:1818-2795(+)